MKVAEQMAGILAATGLRSVFALAGASHTYLLDALERRGIRIVSSRHESGAVSAADGYARASGRLGVALVIADQGLPNAIGGLAAAYYANSPVLVLVACPPAAWTEPGAAFDTSKLQLVASLCKWSRMVHDAGRIADYLQVAIDRAASGRPGPVVLFIPSNLPAIELGVEAEARAAAEVATQGSRRVVSARPEPDAGAIEAAATLLMAAERPLLLAGAGVAWSDSAGALAMLAHEFGVPVAANGLGRGSLPEDGERSFSWPYAQLAAREADCVLVVGSRLMQRQGFGLPPRFAADASFIQVDIEADEQRRNRPIDVFIHADAGRALEALCRALQAKGAGTRRARGDWLRRVLEPRRRRVAELAEAPGAAGAPLHPLRLGRLLAERLPAAAPYVGDGADIQNWMYGAIQVRRRRGFLDHYPLGSMGVGTALSVGVAAALADAGEDLPAVLVTGDGAFGFHASEIHAAARAGLRLVVIIGNNGAWGSEVFEQRRSLGRSVNTELGVLPYERVAEGFGCLGLLARDEAETVAALDRAFAARGPVVVNVHTDPEAGAAIKGDPLLRMILFSDLAEGQRALR